MSGAPREAAVLLADVSDSTMLYETAGDATAHAAIEKCISLMREKTTKAKGEVIRTVGDEVLSAFPSADAAASAAMEMQLAVEGLPRVGTMRLGIRVGFCHGAMVERDGDVFGEAVSLAAQLSRVALKGQIITDGGTVARMSPLLRSLTRPISPVPVRGSAQEIQACELTWRVSADTTTAGLHKSVYKLNDTILRLVLNGSERIVSPVQPAVALGRDPQADLVIREPTASRAHGKIERRLGKFILTDHSANGTFVTVENDREIVLRREEFTLRSHGWIAFGQSRATASEVLEFYCE